MNNKTNLLRLLLSLSVFATAAKAQTFVPKWTNTTVFGANQQFVNDGAYNPVTGNLIVCQSSPDIINVCTTADGHSLSTLNVTGLTGPTYAVSGLCVDTNGSIYSSTYGANTSTNKLNLWTSESSAPTQLIATTLGAGSVGKTMAMYGAGTNAVFILSSTSTGAVYVYNNAGTWAAKTLTVASGTAQGGMTIVSWSPTSCVFITKNSGINGDYNTFNPSSASPITVSQTQYSGSTSALTFATLSGTATTAQGASGYNPTTGLFAFHTRSLTASPFTISNYLCNTSVGNGLAAPSGCSPILSRIGTTTTAADAANYGADFWGNGVYYCAPSAVATGYGFRAFDISAYKVADISPLSQTKNIGDSAAFSVTSGGSGTLAYVWKRNGNVITNGGEYSNATTAALSINPVDAANAGTYTCTVTGAGNLSWTSTNGTLTLNLPSTTAAVTLASGSNPSIYGDSLTFTATISASDAGTPTGSVTFKDGATPVATNVLSGSNSMPTASFTTSTLTATNHSITAVYGGDGSYTGSTSGALTQTVGPLPVVLTGARPYDGTTDAAAGILAVSNILNGDAVSAASGAATLASSWVGSEPISGSGTLVLGGAKAANYTTAGATGIVVITKPNTPFSFSAPYLDDSGTNLVLVWDSIPGASYQLVNSIDLVTWTNFGGPIDATSTKTTNVIPITDLSTQSFFNVH